MVGHGHRRSNSNQDTEPKATSRRRKNKEHEEADSTPNKRRRVTRACDQCRQGREKCDGSKPCHACQAADRQCTFKGESKRRGVQPGYIRALEVLLAWTVTHVDGADMQLRELLAREPITDELGIATKETSASDPLAHAWLHSQIHEDLEQLLAAKTASHEADPSVEGENHESSEHHALEGRTGVSTEDVEMSYAERTLPASIAGFGDETMPTVLAHTYGISVDNLAEPSTLDSMLAFQPDYTALGPESSSLLDIPIQSHPTTLGFGGFNFFNEQAVPYSQSSPSTLDAFLDELASTGLNEIADQQPQFMQNLGFGADFDPSEMMDDSGDWLIP